MLNAYIVSFNVTKIYAHFYQNPLLSKEHLVTVCENAINQPFSKSITTHSD